MSILDLPRRLIEARNEARRAPWEPGELSRIGAEVKALGKRARKARRRTRRTLSTAAES